jgi:3-isopropylmalate/(R)-2-methylmalate dehydratase small subunit
MKPFQSIHGLVTLLDLPHADTDQIIPKQFLKRIERTGFGDYLFYDWRLIDGKRLNPDFEMNAERYQGAEILLTRANFGCGSSREHAVWAIMDYGIRSVIAPSFADIFYNNCFKNGLLPVVLSEDVVEKLFQKVRETPGFRLHVDLAAQRVYSDGLDFRFQIDSNHRHRLLNGLDDIAQTLQHAVKIDRYEYNHLSQ